MASNHTPSTSKARDATTLLPTHKFKSGGEGAAAPPLPAKKQPRWQMQSFLLFLVAQAFLAWLVFMTSYEYSQRGSDDKKPRLMMSSYREGLFGPRRIERATSELGAALSAAEKQLAAMMRDAEKELAAIGLATPSPTTLPPAHEGVWGVSETIGSKPNTLPVPPPQQQDIHKPSAPSNGAPPPVMVMGKDGWPMLAPAGFVPGSAGDLSPDARPSMKAPRKPPTRPAAAAAAAPPTQPVAPAVLVKHKQHTQQHVPTASAGPSQPPVYPPDVVPASNELPAGWVPPYTLDFKGKPVIADNVYVTLVAGNSAARHAIALIQSLVNVGSKYPMVVMLSRGGVGTPECNDPVFRESMGKSGKSFRCDTADAEAWEIASPKYLDAMERLGARILLTDEIVRTQWTETIAGGRNFAWGMSLNKLQIFNMTQFKKIVFMDSDTMAFHNLDHLFGPEYPMFSAAMTYSCCNPQAAPTMSGGFWIVEPHPKWGIRLWDLMVEGKPTFYRNGTQIRHPDGSPVVGEWYLSDLDLVRAMFSVWDRNLYTEAVWPDVHDMRHGTVPGMRKLPYYAAMTDEEYEIKRKGKAPITNPIEGFDPKSPLWDGKTPVFRALDVSYDQTIGNCACLPDRDLKEDYMSIHFSCIPDIIHKPSWYDTEEKLMVDMYGFAESCTRWYYVKHYYAALLQAGVRLDPPYYSGPEVPMWNTTHDAFVLANRAEFRRTGGEFARRW